MECCNIHCPWNLIQYIYIQGGGDVTKGVDIKITHIYRPITVLELHGGGKVFKTYLSHEATKVYKWLHQIGSTVLMKISRGPEKDGVLDKPILTLYVKAYCQQVTIHCSLECS